MLTRPIRLLKCAAKAGLECGAEKAAQLMGLDFWFAWGKRTWEFYSRESQEVRLAEVAELAAATPEEIHEEVVKVVAEAATGESEELRQQVVQLLTQVPATIRQTLRRPADPSGTTVPPGMRLDSAEDVARLLPQRLPRFKPGDRPTGMPWQLEEKLGDGGFGEVWKARHAKFPGIAPVALKFCLDGPSTNALRGKSGGGAAGVLEHEARVVEHVLRHGKHPGIVELRNAYLEADPPCLEYEFVEGGELTKLIEAWKKPDGGVPHRSAAKVVHRLAEVVGFAHRLPEPIVHRDLKPSNVLVRWLPNGRYDLKIADFGIGGLAAEAANRQPSAHPASAVETRLSLMRGAHTPLYSSPQQKRGGHPDPRDDVHALGVIWYRCSLATRPQSGRPEGPGNGDSKPRACPAR